jgi:LuxR family maltose regulon positive regulatory protein
MVNPLLLHTKFLIPRPRPDHLARTRLLRQLKAGLGKKLVLVSAPPGYGKTTLLASLAHQATLPLVWYQLDPADNDPTVFLHYLIQGLHYAFPELGQGTLNLLDDREVQMEQVLMVFLNEVTASLENDFLIILEDYHWISNPDNHRILDFLLEHQPPQMHFLISTRVEPPLSLARLRACGDLVELRTQDLRFTLDEIGRITAHLPLAPPQVRLLEERTEGWAAGLQLALTSLAQKPQEAADEVIHHFRGSNRYVFDYLAQEVFQQQPPRVQSFLLRSSVLTQMSAETCNTILGTSDAQFLLEYLERQNLFVVSLDEERRWYRYHQLFRDFLLNRFCREAETEALHLQATAGDYYAQQGLWDLAAEHYTAARSTDGLARAIHALASTYLQNGRVETLHRYILALSPSFVNKEPDFLLYQGHVLRHWGRVEEAITCYERACTLYKARGERAKISHVLTQLARMARSQGHYRRAQKLAQAAVAEADDTDHAERAEALMALAKNTGFLEGMEQGYKLGEAALQEAQLAGTALSSGDRARLLWSQAQLSWWYGDPFATVAHCQAALTADGDAVSPLACRVYAVMASPYLYWGELSMARQLAEKGITISEQLQFTEWLPMAHATLGNVLSRQEELAPGEQHLRQAIAVSRELGAGSYAGLMASGFLAFNLVQQRRLVEARQTCEEALHLYAGSPETYELCVCRSVLGDVLLDMEDLDTAWEYFLNLRHICEARQFRLPLAMVYFALGYLHLEAGRYEAALDLIRRSMALVRHANAVQLYLDQGQRALAVCRAAQEAGIYLAFVERVIAALTQAQGPIYRVLSPAVLPTLQEDAGEEAIEAICLDGFQLFYQRQEMGKEVGFVGKPRELLAYFIAHRHQRLPLDRILEDVWPGSDPARGQAVFHTTVYRLRRALTKVAGPGEYICHESGEYYLERERFQIDLDLFDAYLAQAQASVGEAAIRAYQMAVDLYRAPYFTTFYYEWCEKERRDLTDTYLTALRILTAHYAAVNDHHRAIATCERMLEVDPLLEQVHCDLMRFWHRLGNRAAVARQYRTLTQLLADELAADPMPETQALYAELAGEGSTPSP